MKLVSVNVGLPREVSWQGKQILTGIFKEPISGAVMLRTLNLDGDKQADLSVHGGITKAVYGYPVEHYQYWRNELPDMTLPWGMFGENFTIEGLLEDDARIGDKYRIGKAELMVTEPRLPCFKLGIKFGNADIIKRFHLSRRTGFYFAVLKEGEVEAGDEIELLSRDEDQITITEMTRLYAYEKDDLAALQRIVKVKALSEDWRDYFQKQIERLTS